MPPFIEKHFLALLLLCLSAASASGQNFYEFQNELTQTLLKTDVGELADQVAEEPASDIYGLSKQIEIFERAGHETRARQAVLKMLDAPDAAPNYHTIKNALRKYSYDDAAIWKTFYERVEKPQNEQEDEFKFLEKWEKSANLDRIETWLVERYDADKNWFDILFGWREKHNRADAMRARYCEEIQTNFAAKMNDIDVAEKTLARAPMCRNFDLFAQNYNSSNAFDNYWFGSKIYFGAKAVGDNIERARRYDIAVRLLRRSLELPYQKSDGDKICGVAWRYSQMPPFVRNFNPEKQIRFWTKSRLAELYKEAAQPQLAQPIVEELSAMDKTGIVQDDPNRLAGAVQAASGQRAVEARILREEATRRDSSVYWLERVQYYEGRSEPQLVAQTYAQALDALPYVANQMPKTLRFSYSDVSHENGNAHRLHLIGNYLNYFNDLHGLDCDKSEDEIEKGEPQPSGEKSSDEDRQKLRQCNQLEQFWRAELTRAANNYPYVGCLLEIANDSDLRHLTKETFTRNPELLARLFAAAANSYYYDTDYFITQVYENKKISRARKQSLWQQLETAASDGDLNRTYRVSENMFKIGETARAIRLLQICLQEMLPENDDDEFDRYEFTRGGLMSRLFDAYLQQGDWKIGEQILFADLKDAHLQTLQNSIGRIALAAAQKGAVDDAVRLWKLSANIDRREFKLLPEMAKTNAKTALQQFYTEMKRRDKNSIAPDKALALLQ